MNVLLSVSSRKPNQRIQTHTRSHLRGYPTTSRLSFLHAVINDCAGVLMQAAIGNPLIGVERGTNGNILVNYLVQIGHADGWNHLCPHWAVTLVGVALGGAGALI